MTPSIAAQALTSWQDRALERSDWPATPPAGQDDDPWHWIAANHRFNTLLWNEEDKARRTDVDASEIATCKRLIDRYNQQRNDAVERLDELLVGELEGIDRDANARLHSETAGAMVDRLSILALKIFHMREQTQRVDASAEHIATCRGKLARLQQQRADLASCLDQLLEEAAAGRAYFKIYRQFKMYNDPTLNPWLYGSRPQAGSQAAEKAAPHAANERTR